MKLSISFLHMFQVANELNYFPCIQHVRASTGDIFLDWKWFFYTISYKIQMKTSFRFIDLCLWLYSSFMTFKLFHFALLFILFKDSISGDYFFFFFVSCTWQHSVWIIVHVRIIMWVNKRVYEHKFQCFSFD